PKPNAAVRLDLWAIRTDCCAQLLSDIHEVRPVEANEPGFRAQPDQTAGGSDYLAHEISCGPTWKRIRYELPLCEPAETTVRAEPHRSIRRLRYTVNLVVKVSLFRRVITKCFTTLPDYCWIITRKAARRAEPPGPIRLAPQIENAIIQQPVL